MTDVEHRLVFEYDRDHVTCEMRCYAEEGADCRLVGMDNCNCEFWNIERAHEGAAPYHQVDTVGGAEILHWMKDGGECNYCTWINESGIAEELNSERESFMIAAIPVEQVWTGDGAEWRRAGRDG